MMSLTQAEVRARVAALGPWFHNLELAGTQTAPDHPLGDYPRMKWRRFRDALAPHVAGRTVLDIGCNGGFYALEMKRLGAARVLAVDHDADYLAQARFAAEVEGQDIELRQLSVYEVGRIGERFDIVLFMGVLYHLRHPLLALDLVHEHVAGDLLVFQTMLRGSSDVARVEPDYPIRDERPFDHPAFPRLHFVEHAYASDPTNWWVPNRACAEAMLRSAGFRIEARPEDEVWLCRRDALGGVQASCPVRPRDAVGVGGDVPSAEGGPSGGRRPTTPDCASPAMGASP